MSGVVPDFHPEAKQARSSSWKGLVRRKFSPGCWFGKRVVARPGRPAGRPYRSNCVIIIGMVAFQEMLLQNKIRRDGRKPQPPPAFSIIGN